jgi:hypothetical protein
MQNINISELDIIKIDIRNFKELTNNQKEILLHISNADKYDIIILYDKMMKWIFSVYIN